MKLIKHSFAIILFSFFALSSVKAAEPINTLEKTGLVGYEPSEVAIRGYDTVAYFTDSKPVKGTEEHQFEWMGSAWYFASESNKELFAANPEKYAPQYGGYCAYGVAQNALVKIEGDQWKIIDDKLYLNYNANVQEKWLKDTPGFIASAEAKFDSLLAE